MPYDTAVQDHAEQYAAAHQGRHPYTDCWPWAQGILAWADQNTGRPKSTLGNRPLVSEGEAGHLVAALAEALRLSMVSYQCPIGDLDLDYVRKELWYWTHGQDYPAPGTAGWPAPTGPYTGVWHALFLAPDAGLRQRASLDAGDLLRALLHHTAARPHLPEEAVLRLTAYRLETTDKTYVALAEAAPSLGITGPVEVRDPLFHRGVEGLTTIRQR
ncbi:hypothetical protein [Streptomyces sp. NPDC047071]|uniref:hypothetical protein n=1 Tax=Streptomyces sp. NPDC047071 TaxID=3154808 RepID=UPI003454926E